MALHNIKLVYPVIYSMSIDYMSRIVRKADFCICKNKDTDQLHGSREADQRLCFRFIDSTIPLLPTYEISSLWPSCVVVHPGLCVTWSETPKTGFLTTRLISLRLISSTVLLFPKFSGRKSRANSLDPDQTAYLGAVLGAL